jgi:hypothetical protein
MEVGDVTNSQRALLRRTVTTTVESDYGSATEDSTANKDFNITMTLSVNSADCSYVMLYAMVEFLQ